MNTKADQILKNCLIQKLEAGLTSDDDRVDAIHQAMEQYAAAQERFERPPTNVLFDFALAFNDGKLDKDKLVDMVSLGEFIIDRLYDNGNLRQKSKRELEVENNKPNLN